MASSTGRGTVRAADNFNAEKVAAKFRKAMKGISTDERIIIDVLVGHNNSQRQVIKKKYKSMYGRKLEDDLKVELGGHFEDVCLALLAPMSEYLIDCIYKAVKGIGTDDRCIIQIICSLESLELKYIKNTFKEKYNKDLAVFVCDDLGGDFKKLVHSLLTVDRDDSAEINDETVQIEAQRLLDAGVAKWGTDEQTFLTIITTRSKIHLKAVFEAYELLSGHTVEQAVENEFSGSLKEALIAIIKSMENQHEFYAQALYDSMKGIGTDDRTLIRILVSRSEIDLRDITVAYKKKYGKELSDAVASDTSGDYRKILLRLLNP